MREKIKIILRNIFAVFIWLYVFIKLFIIDIDIYILQNYFPNYSSLIYFKFFILIPLISFLWIISGTKNFISQFSYIIFYPLILLLWIIPKTLFQRKSWFLIFTYINSLVNFIKSFKTNLALISIFSVCALFIIKTENIYIVSLSCFGMTMVLIYHFYKRFYFAFSPSTAFAIDTKTINKYLKNDKQDNILISGLLSGKVDQESESDDENRYRYLQYLLIYNRLFLFVSEKLKRFQESRVYIIFFVIGLIYTLIISITVFGFINYSIYKLDPSNFNISTEPKLINFIYYSFYSILANQINEIIPVGTISKLLNMTEIIIGLLIIVILISIMFSVQSDRYKEELGNIITTVGSQGELIEKHINDEFRLSISQAILILEVEKIKGSLIKIIYYLGKNIS